MTELTIEWLQLNIAHWQCLENCGQKIPKTMIPMAKQLLATMRREANLRGDLLQILDDGQFIADYRDDDTPIFTTDEKRRKFPQPKEVA